MLNADSRALNSEMDVQIRNSRPMTPSAVACASRPLTVVAIVESDLSGKIKESFLTIELDSWAWPKKPSSAKVMNVSGTNESSA